jgi:hypothetical protein
MCICVIKIRIEEQFVLSVLRTTPWRHTRYANIKLSILHWREIGGLAWIDLSCGRVTAISRQ